MPARLYPAKLTPAAEGGFVVTFPDIPEAITQGENVEHALSEAADALDEALIGRVNSGYRIPVPSRARQGQYLIPVYLRKPRS